MHKWGNLIILIKKIGIFSPFFGFLVGGDELRRQNWLFLIASWRLVMCDMVPWITFSEENVSAQSDQTKLHLEYGEVMKDTPVFLLSQSAIR